ncbi:MAG: tRNA uridine-5-carboxymethylaminomethyl(34) synthesis GTPase MnmE [Bacteroidales bacterium]|nr:tRNA uridine-5-carboxymethylaminomethyl(34) synthesis GTPase MnmE [Bacteroidales bacterium]
MKTDDTIFAPATSVGAGAISVVRLSGPQAIDIASSVLDRPLRDLPGYSARFCRVLEPDGAELDAAVVTVFRAPHSYTGEDSVEFSCHASPFVVSRLMALLGAAGARPAEAGEFTRRAFVNGKMDLAQAEAVADLIASESRAAHRVAMNQLRGGFSAELQEMRDKLLELTTLMELELDFSEEEVIFADRSKLLALADGVCAKAEALRDSFRLGNAIRKGVPVAIVGAANTGKSTLLNALLGEDRAIVSDIAGTTRDTVEETLTLGETLFRFIDTAGIRESDDAVEKLGIGRSLDKLHAADIVLGVLDLSAAPEVFLAVAKRLVSEVDFTQQRLVLIGNKCDKEGVNKNVIALNNFVLSPDYKSFNIESLPLSAKTGDGVGSLKALLQVIQSARLSAQPGTLVIDARHADALGQAADALRDVRFGLRSGTPTDLVAQDLRRALHHLGTITGAVTTDDVLSRIFSRFCIGK